MSDANDHFNRVLRGQTDEPAPERAKTDSEKFSDLIRSASAANNAAADAMTDWFAKRIQKQEGQR